MEHRQLPRPLPSEGKGRVFESRRARDDFNDLYETVEALCLSTVPARARKGPALNRGGPAVHRRAFECGGDCTRSDGSTASWLASRLRLAKSTWLRSPRCRPLFDYAYR